jgi:hypothetical protein
MAAEAITFSLTLPSRTLRSVPDADGVTQWIVGTTSLREENEASTHCCSPANQQCMLLACSNMRCSAVVDFLCSACLAHATRQWPIILKQQLVFHSGIGQASATLHKLHCPAKLIPAQCFWLFLVSIGYQQVQLLEYDPAHDQLVAKASWVHPEEVWDISCCPGHTGTFVTAHAKGALQYLAAYTCRQLHRCC